MSVLVADKLTDSGGEKIPDEWAVIWKRAAVASVQEVIRLEAELIDDIGQELVKIGVLLERAYKCAVLETDTLHANL